MSQREWKPGDVATDGVFAVLRSARGGFAYADGSFVADEACGVLTYRPLVVLDPEDRESVERLDKAYQRAIDTSAGGLTDVMQAALRSLIAPPKPPEPQGLGAVVEDAKGLLWVRLNHQPPTEDPWKPYDSRSRRCAYADIDAVKVLSEGVRDE